jgi:Phosphate-selective porin O and P
MKRAIVFTAGVLCLAAPLSAQLAIEGQGASIKFGVQGQLWADWTQDPASGGYAQNLYLRRARLMVGGDIGEDVSFFFQTDDPKLGLTPKALASGFLIQDAFLTWKPTKAFQLVGGPMLVPFSRNALQSTVSFYTLDVSPITTVNNASTQSSALRDAGFGANGFFFKDRLQYRTGVFQGERDSNGRNSLRAAAYVQYDFFSTETGYTFAGTALGTKKILAIDAGADKQGAYRSDSANIAADLPVRHGDEIGAQFQFIHYDGRQKFLTIPDQNDYMVEAAYYLHRAKVQPFAKAEAQKFVAAANDSKNVTRYGGGVNYYIHGQKLKWTCQYLRAVPNSMVKPANEFTMQLQVFYY